MKTYTVRVPEVHYSYIIVEAESKREAIQQMFENNGCEWNF